MAPLKFRYYYLQLCYAFDVNYASSRQSTKIYRMLATLDDFLNPACWQLEVLDFGKGCDLIVRTLGFFQ